MLYFHKGGVPPSACYVFSTRSPYDISCTAQRRYSDRTPAQDIPSGQVYDARALLRCACHTSRTPCTNTYRAAAQAHAIFYALRADSADHSALRILLSSSHPVPADVSQMGVVPAHAAPKMFRGRRIISADLFDDIILSREHCPRVTSFDPAADKISAASR